MMVPIIYYTWNLKYVAGRRFFQIIINLKYWRGLKE
jgi:hypothetical protein